jgi:hypothetical protein
VGPCYRLAAERARDLRQQIPPKPSSH